MYISVRASRVVVGGLDSMAALYVVLASQLGAPFFGWLADRAWGWPGIVALLAGFLVHVVAASGCRFRLVADGRDCVLYRTWFGVPWSRRSYGRRASVVVDLGWDWEELAIVPEESRDEEDRFTIAESTMSALSGSDLEAFAAAADREIGRVAGPPEIHPGTYRTA
ncbi:MAG TPA: hypothetical protein VLS89_14495 [Candidatus Nanopelagicales bacterium]|nr:hypothetical protein [Candidatus Nanopelagicales bacterium]